jgi:hypothetical protein
MQERLTEQIQPTQKAAPLIGLRDASPSHSPLEIKMELTIFLSLCGAINGVQLANPASGGGANGESLIYYQKSSITEFPLNI